MSLFKKTVNNEIKKMERGESIISRKDDDAARAADVIKQLSGADRQTNKKLIDNFIVFTNAAGGTGTTTLITNVAYAMATQGFKVLLIDLNIMFPAIHAYFGIEQSIDKNKPDLVSYLLGKSKLNESIDTTHEVHLLYANNRNIMDEINCNENIALDNFNQLITGVRKYYDVVLVDCPMRIDCRLQNNTFYNADAVYLVWDEGANCILNTEKIRRNMAITGIGLFTKMQVILNKRTGIFYSKFALEKLNLNLTEIVPYEQDVVYDSLRGAIFCKNGESNSPTSKLFVERIYSLTDKILKTGGYIEE